jgi:hypothetical protein
VPAIYVKSADGIEAKDGILIYDGDITVVSDKDALHSENDEDSSLGYIYMKMVHSISLLLIKRP